MKTKHIHHIQPKYLIGEDNSPDNLTPPISLDLHAALHKDLYEHLGNTEDFIAWKTLLGLSLKGITFTSEVKQKISESKKGKPHPHKGHEISEETKKKISIANKGEKVSTETRLKMAKTRKGKKHSEKTKNKISNSLLGNTRSLGYKFTEEQKQKLSKKRKMREFHKICLPKDLIL